MHASHSCWNPEKSPEGFDRISRFDANFAHSKNSSDQMSESRLARPSFFLTP
jgi:hypothetical protein